MKVLYAKRFIHVLASLVLFGLLHSADAALPTSLNYQGHLTDTTGAPVDGSVNMIFRIYNIDTGGTVLWSGSLPVTVQHGVFSVELGGTANPFPLGLFEQSLWIGLEVSGDGEMNPRRPITSTGFAFKADDANTLEGVSASTLDQSAHVTDTANPHNVTTSQIGAADAGTLASHISNTSNPHSVTAVQTGAASIGDFTAHASNSAAHHTRYTNGEAVTSMGAKNDANALNHDKYSNANAVAAILAADGAGSTLDADKVDGLQASEIIDAAQDEVRTPISSLPFIIDQPGSYYLTGNLNGASAGGVDIIVDNVTLDMMGFIMDGGAVNDYGISFGGSHITIRNGIVRGFGMAGIFQSNSNHTHATLVDMQVIGNGSLGSSYKYSGIYILSSNSHIERCTASDNSYYGIFADASSKLINNTAFNNGGTYAIHGGSGAILRGNTAYQNASGYAIYGDHGSLLSGNTAYQNTSSYGIYGYTSASLSGNTAYSNSGTGIYGGTGASIIDNIASSNSSTGIYGSYGSTLRGNTSYNNAGSYGILADSGSTVIGNTVYSNSKWGIYSTGSNIIKDNNLYNNNTSITAGMGGMRIYFDSRVTDNSLDSNRENNLYVSSSDNTIENNSFTDSTNGIFFSVSGNFYGNNRASGNTTNFNLNGTTQTTSTYLPNIGF